MNTDSAGSGEKSRSSILKAAWVPGILIVLAGVWIVMNLLNASVPAFADYGPQAPIDWTVEDVRTGETIRIDDYRGEVLVLNFWATWCPPCRIEKPALDRLHQAMDDEGLKVLAVSLQEDPRTVNAYLYEHGYVLPMATLATAPPAAFQISAVPTTFVINRHGEIVLKHEGAFRGWDGDAMQNQLRALLGPTNAESASR